MVDTDASPPRKSQGDLEVNSLKSLSEDWAKRYVKVNFLQSFSEAWAKRYVQNLTEHSRTAKTFFRDTTSAITAEKLLQLLRPTSLQAWTKTEALLAQEVIRHQIDSRLIEPWEIAKDAYQIYEKALSAYAEQVTPAKLSISISADLGHVRQKCTAVDPRVIGFTSMQFHYIGQILLEPLSQAQKNALSAYFKVIDDHLYMPLQRAYNAAAMHDYDSPALRAVQRLLPLSSEIAARVVAQVTQLYPSYHCHTGLLSEPAVQISSVRDVEMFQVYLWVCILENSINAVQHELFPLCVMLYPRLKVRWELVRQLIHLLGIEIRANLKPQLAAYYEPYHRSLWAMFSPQVFPAS